MIEPAYLSYPDRLGSFGDEACDFYRTTGRALDPEQVLCIDAILSYGRGGLLVALEAAVLEARQNGKTLRVELPVALYLLFFGQADKVFWTSHLFRTTKAVIAEVKALVDSSPDMSRRVKKITESHGEERLVLHSGAEMEFLARQTGRGGRGQGAKLVVLDEALYLGPAEMGALMPTLSARSGQGDPMLLYGSSAAKVTSPQLHKVVKRGRAGKDPALAYVEFCAPGSWEDPGCERGELCTHLADHEQGCALDLRANWERANHALPLGRISYAFLAAERRSLDAAEFGREVLGWHEYPVEVDQAERSIDPRRWRELTTPDTVLIGECAVGVDVAPNRRHAAIALYGAGPTDADGAPVGHLELLDYRPGAAWVVDRMAEIRDELNPIGFAMASGTYRSLRKALALAGFEPPEDLTAPGWGDLHVLTPADMAAGCAGVIDATREGTFLIKPDAVNRQVMDLAVASAEVREGSDRVAWARAKDAKGDITPVVAATEARHTFGEWADLVSADYDIAESLG